MSTFDCSDMVLLMCKLQLNQVTIRYLSFNDLFNIFCTASVFKSSSEVKDLMMKIIRITREMFACLYKEIEDGDYEYQGGIPDDDMPHLYRKLEVFCVNSRLLYTTISDLSYSRLDFILRVSLDVRRNSIRICDYRRHCIMDIDVFPSSDKKFYRGALYASGLSDQSRFATDFEIECVSLIRICDLVPRIF